MLFRSLVNSLAIAHLFWAGVFTGGSRQTELALRLALTEVAIFILFRGRCPLSSLVDRLGAERAGVSDIFLPTMLASRVPYLCGPPLLVGLIGLGLRKPRGEPPGSERAA